MSNIESNERVVLDPPESTIDEDWLEQEVGGDGRGGADCQDVPALAPADWSEPDECIDTEQVPVGLRAKALAEGNVPLSLALYGLLGLAFGILLVKSDFQVLPLAYARELELCFLDWCEARSIHADEDGVVHPEEAVVRGAVFVAGNLKRRRCLGEACRSGDQAGDQREREPAY